ncbi:MAG: hypothetical protein BA863_07720 [Desulfovibrio sp. S3730MH75]|nr:MAG: hypothetical protein BA863_07720 [Desulfovibrio sp. S3730MH75]
MLDKKLEKKKSYEHQSQNIPKQQPQLELRPKKYLYKVLKSIVLGGILVGGIYALSTSFLPGMFGGDSISNAQRTSIGNNFSEAVNAGVSILQPVNFLDPEERREAKLASGLPDKKAELLMREAEAGIISLARLTLWDNYDEDGDVVEVKSNGMTRIVPIRHAKTTIVIPYSFESPSLSIKGIHDGGGGITISAVSSSGELPLPVMAVGETRVLEFR